MRAPVKLKDTKLLGVDIGTKRIGLALWNPAAQLTRPLPHRLRRTLKEDLEFFRKLLEEHDIQAIVVGIPTNLHGQDTPSTKNARFWLETFKEHFKIPILEQDESLSTKEALSLLKQQQAKNKKTKVDSLAACIILEDFVKEH